jgi:hypothetical protein
MVLAMATDAMQIFVFPLFAEGALSPADDVLDLAVAAALVRLLGSQMEFLPAFLAGRAGRCRGANSFGKQVASRRQAQRSD